MTSTETTTTISNSNTDEKKTLEEVRSPSARIVTSSYYDSWKEGLTVLSKFLSSGFLFNNDNKSDQSPIHHNHETVDDIDLYIREEIHKLALHNPDPEVLALDAKFKDFPGHDKNPLTSLISMIKDSLFPPETTLKDRLTDGYVPVWDTIDEEIVIVGGYKGSILKELATGKKLWFSLRTGFNLQDCSLLIGPRPEDEERVQREVIPEDMMCEIGPVDISMKLKMKLQESGKCKVHTFGYDWRLSQHINSAKLHDFLKNLDCNQPGSKRKGAIVIAHSMGGLVSHHAMQRNPSLFKGLVYAGVPSETANILGPFKYGDPMLFNNDVITPESSFFMRSSFVFLPEDGRCFVNRKTGERYDLDFFNPDIWTEFNLCPLVSQQRLDYENTVKQQPLSNSSIFKGSESSKFNYSVSFAECKEYLTRTLKETKKFLDDLNFDPSKKYPPLVMLYADTTPTGTGSYVPSLKFVKDGEWEDEDKRQPIFGAGDGTVYHKYLMPERRKGFQVERKVRSERSHMGLLTDLDGVGRCLAAILTYYQKQEDNEE